MALSLELNFNRLLATDELVTNAILNDVIQGIAIEVLDDDISVLVPDYSVTTAKLADGALSADASGRAKMADLFLTAAKLAQDAAADVHQYAAGVYAAGVYAITLSPARTGAYVAGEVVRFKPDTANAGAADININGRGAANLYAARTSAFVNGDRELKAGVLPTGAIVTAVYDGTDFVLLTVQGADRFVCANQAVPTSAATITVAHGLAGVPAALRGVLVCTSDDATPGYVAGDEVDFYAVRDSTAQFLQVFPAANATNVYAVASGGGNNWYVPKKDGSAAASLITKANWRVKLYAAL